MKLIHYVEIENFKTFEKLDRIDLAHPAVLIGPNNSGKTSVIQALALWSRGVSEWYSKKGIKAKSHIDDKKKAKQSKQKRWSTGINRLNILEVPVSESRFYWHNTRVRKGAINIEFTINVGIDVNGIIKDCRFLFNYRDAEVIYCRPCNDTINDIEVIDQAANVAFYLLYPMSGIMSGASVETEETPLPDGRINLLLGQGQTAQVLRNICYKVVENDTSLKDVDRCWPKIAHLMHKLFMVNVDKPVYNKTRGSLSMTYMQDDVDKPLDIALAGRGMQQMLLVVSYLYWHKNCVLLVDEPDAHLELLRQRQVYEILKEVAEETNSQVIIATHSEVILDTAIDTNLTMLMAGTAVDLAQSSDMKKTLRSMGIDHYYKARINPRLLFVEGTSDINMMKAIARLIDHGSYDLLCGPLNVYYTENVVPSDDLDTRLDRAGGYYGNFKKHFHTLRRFVTDLKGLAILDSDGKTIEDTSSPDLQILHWKRYEIENYIISPSLLLAYLQTQRGAGLFDREYHTAIDEALLEVAFEGNRNLLDEFHSQSQDMQSMLLADKKMSAIAESAFKHYSDITGAPLLLRKSEYYRLVEFIDPAVIPREVVDKLDVVEAFLHNE